MLRITSAWILRCVCLGISMLVLAAPAAFSGADRSFPSAGKSLTVSGLAAGLVKSAEGGAISAEVINEPASPNNFTKKHVGQPKYELLKLLVGFSMAADVYNWIADAWAMNYQRKDCALTELDHSNTPKSTREFAQCLIGETTIPACDGSSKEPSYLGLTLAPEFIREVQPAGVKGDYGRNEQKLWLPSNFELEDRRPRLHQGQQDRLFHGEASGSHQRNRRCT